MNRLKDIESAAHGNAGAIASVLSTMLLYPLENVKTRMHVDESPTGQLGVRETINSILQNEGIQGLYKGMTPLVFGNYISYGVYFYWYEYFKHVFATNNSNPFEIIKPSFCSAVLTSVVTNPFWVVQSHMTVSKDNLNFLQKTLKIVETQGWQVLFKGLQASLILTINPIVQFLIYEIIKKRFQYSSNQVLVTFIGGAISKAIATIITYPYQVLRTKCHISSQKKMSYWIAFQKIIREESVKGLFKGLTPKLSQSVLNSAFLLMFYEKIYEMIRSAIILAIIELLKYKKQLKKMQKSSIKV